MEKGCFSRFHVTESNALRKFGILFLYTKLTGWIVHVILTQHTRGSSSLLTQLKRLSVAN